MMDDDDSDDGDDDDVDYVDVDVEVALDIAFNANVYIDAIVDVYIAVAFLC